MDSPHEITELLLAWEQGDESALERLMPLVMEELRRLAKSYMRTQKKGHTLQTTALINEAFIKLVDQKPEFRVRDFTDAPSLARKFAAKEEPLSEYLYSQLTPGTWRLLAQCVATGHASEQFLKALATDLNRLLKGQSLYEPTRFKQVTLAEKTRQLLEQNPEGKELIRLNRQLLEDAYPREIAKKQKTHWQNRKHFYAIAARCMRQVLIDHARAKNRGKGPGNKEHIPLPYAPPIPVEEPVDLVDLLALDEALHKLAKLDARQSQIVELRFFGGYTMEDIAEILEIHKTTVEREWGFARAWLGSELGAKPKAGRTDES
jgi:RNA polymerase sigma factor (TIGR02999 family)